MPEAPRIQPAPLQWGKHMAGLDPRSPSLPGQEPHEAVGAHQHGVGLPLHRCPSPPRPGAAVPRLKIKPAISRKVPWREQASGSERGLVGAQGQPSPACGVLGEAGCLGSRPGRVTKPLCMARGSPGHSHYPQILGKYFFPIHHCPDHPDEWRLGQCRGCSSLGKSPHYLPPAWGKDAGGLRAASPLILGTWHLHEQGGRGVRQGGKFLAGNES